MAPHTEKVLRMEERTARLTILIDPRKKAVFEQLCQEEDVTPSQVVRRLIRRYIEERIGEPWVPTPRTRSRTDASPAATKESKKARG
jgi:hypothetical protein